MPLDEVVRMIVKVDSSLDLLISRVEGHTGIEVNGESNLLFLYGDYEGNARKKELRCWKSETGYVKIFLKICFGEKLELSLRTTSGRRFESRYQLQISVTFVTEIFLFRSADSGGNSGQSLIP